MKWWHWLVIGVLLLLPIVLPAYTARFMAVTHCGTLTGRGSVFLRDRATSRGYRLDVNCDSPIPGNVSFL